MVLGVVGRPVWWVSFVRGLFPVKYLCNYVHVFYTVFTFLQMHIIFMAAVSPGFIQLIVVQLRYLREWGLESGRRFRTGSTKGT